MASTSTQPFLYHQFDSQEQTMPRPASSDHSTICPSDTRINPTPNVLEHNLRCGDVNHERLTRSQPSGTVQQPLVCAKQIEGGKVEAFLHAYGNANYVGVRYIDEQGIVLRSDAFAMRLDNFVAPPHISTAQNMERPIPGNMHAIPGPGMHHGHYAGGSFAQNWQTNVNEHFPNHVYQHNIHANH